MAERRRYTKRQKATAVIAAELSNASAAAEELGIPRKTLAYWLDLPEYADLRHKTRDEMSAGMATIVHLAQARIIAKLDEFEPRDLVTLLGVATDKAQLLSGEATSRLESLDLSRELTDEELRDALRDRLTTPGEDGAPAEAAGAPAV